MELIDISVPIRPGMIVYEGDPDISLELVSSIAGGGICNISRIEAGVHTGTHIDAPYHFIDGASAVDQAPLEALIGPAYVVDAALADTDIDAATLAGLEIPAGTQRLLLKTRNSRLWDLPAFSRDFVGITEDGAQWLVKQGVRLVGIDYLSVAPFLEPIPTHQVLLAAGVVIVEALDLREVEPGEYELFCLPLRLVGADGAPARAVLRRA
ncbi:MAG: cyclase family protein [Dehalococcoidia bacterium]